MFNITIDLDEVARLRLSNSELSFNTYAWMAAYFENCDHSPNKDGIIELEPIDKCQIYTEEYLVDFCNHNLEAVSLTYFNELWRDCFPHVRILQQKSVTGKCNVCTDLSELKKRWLFLT